MSTSEKLRSARAAILAFEPERATKILLDLEASGKLQSSENDAHMIANELRAIGELAAAARDGVAAAQDQLKELMQLSQSLGTYDKAGNRQIRDLSAQALRKF